MVMGPIWAQQMVGMFKEMAEAAPPGQQSSKSMMPLVIALGTVVLMTIAIVAYFILRK